MAAMAAMAGLRAALDASTDCDLGALSRDELVALIDELSDEQVLVQFRRITEDADFWHWATADHEHGSTGLRGP